MSPAKWISYIQADIDAGAELVTLETREGGRGGICRSNGELRYGLIEEILESKIDHNRLLFEAPSTTLQTYFVQRVGPDANLGNIAVTDIVPSRRFAWACAAIPCSISSPVTATAYVLAMRESRDVFHLAILPTTSMRRWSSTSRSSAASSRGATTTA